MRRPMKKQDPKMPTRAEREEHGMTHIPFRSWCKHCVRGRGKEEPCKRSGRVPEGVAEIHMDFMFMGEEKGERTLSMLVSRTRFLGLSIVARVALRISSRVFLVIALVYLSSLWPISRTNRYLFKSADTSRSALTKRGDVLQASSSGSRACSNSAPSNL